MKGRRAGRPGLGIALMLLACACFASMDNSVRYIGQFLPVLLVLFARYATQALVMAAWLGGSRREGFRTAHPRFQLLRGLLLLVTSAFSFLGLQYMPVAEFTAIIMLTPVMVTLMSAGLLHEQVSRLRWALVFGGFVGALIVIRPGSGLFGWAVLLPLAGAITNASFQVLTSRLAGLESPYTTHFCTGFIGAAMLAPLLALFGPDLHAAVANLPWRHVAILVAIGLFGTFGHLFLILSFGLAPTATLMPFAYAQIALASAVGWLLFRTVPDDVGFLGMGVIAVCGAASAWLNVRDAHRPASAVTADSVAD